MYRDISIERLKDLMREYGFSQQDVTDRTGIPKSTMSMYLSGKRGVDQDRLTILANLFDTNEAYLMGLDVPKDNFSKTNIEKTFNQDEQVKRLLTYYNKLNQSDKTMLNDMAQRLADKNK